MKDVFCTEASESLLYNSIDNIVMAHNLAENQDVREVLVEVIKLMLVAIDKENIHHPLEIEKVEYESRGTINLVNLDIY